MSEWITLSFIVMFLWAFHDVVHRYFMKIGFNAIEIVLYGIIPTTIAAIIYVYYQNIKLTKPTLKQSGLFIISGILSFIGFLLIRQAQLNSPNMGYVNAITYSSVIFTIILTSIIFKDKFSTQGVVGSILIIIGLAMITSTNKKSTSKNI